MDRKNVEFISKGQKCSGWLFMPDGIKNNAATPAVVMAHGFASVKEMGLADFAQRFAEAGMATLVFDYRCWGESGGEPRNQLIPGDMVEDYRNAITWLSQQAVVDPERIGIWGTSYSGGLVLAVAAFDPRVRAVVAQVPSAVTPSDRQKMDPAAWDRGADFLLQDRIQRYQSGETNYIKIVDNSGGPCALPFEDLYHFYMQYKDDAPDWENKITLESLEKVREFDPACSMPLISPAALLMIAAENDEMLPIAAIRQAFDRAQEPKELKVLPIGHFDPYTEPWQPKTAGMAVEWFKTHLV